MSIFREYARYNSGTHFLDSGGAYGRHHQQPAIDDDAPIVTWEKGEHCDDVPATIETALYLETHLEVDEDLMAMFDTFCELHPEEPWFEVSTMFLESIGFTQHARDNVYNNENDFSQQFVWEVWTNDSNEPDWIYPKDKHVTVIFIHTGCDVRGGYSPPIFSTEVKSDCEYPLPLDFVCGYYATPCTPTPDNQSELPGIPQPRTAEEGLQEVNDRCGIGYSSYPLSELEEFVEEWLPSDDLPCDQKRVRIDGVECIVSAYCSGW